MTSPFTRMLASLIFVALLAAPAVFAQETAPPPPEMPQVEIDFTEDELRAFANAYVDIEQIQARYQAQFGEVNDPEEAQQIQQQFQAEVIQTIDENEIDADRYDEVIRATQVDPEFTERVLAVIQEVREERMEG